MPGEIKQTKETRRVYVLQRRADNGEWVDTSGSYSTEDRDWQRFKEDYRRQRELFGDGVRPVYRRTVTTDWVVEIKDEP